MNAGVGLPSELKKRLDSTLLLQYLRAVVIFMFYMNKKIINHFKLLQEL